MQACQRLKHEHPDCWVNTHISETRGEVSAVQKENPDCADYLAVYEKYGLVGPRFSGGHGIWLSDDEFRRFSNRGAAVVFCPCSNLFLGSGLFRIGRATDPALARAARLGQRHRRRQPLLDAGRARRGLQDRHAQQRHRRPIAAEAERNKISPYRGFWSITLGGAEALYLDELVGNFEPGKEADFVALDWNAGQKALAWRQSLVTGGTSANHRAGGRPAVRRHDGRRRSRGRRDLGDGKAALQESGVNRCL